MTPEERWLTGRVSDLLISPEFGRLAGKQFRKWRLFSAACCHHALALSPDARLGGLAGTAVQFADGAVTWDGVKKARRVLTAVRKELDPDEFGPDEVRYCIVRAHDAATNKSPLRMSEAVQQTTYAFAAVTRRTDWDSGRFRAESELAALARDIFGNPFWPVAFDPEWRTSTAVAVASSMYEARDFAHMPVLADALQDAGCEDTSILGHCRDPGQVHVRGCWVVDLVLGKA